MTTFHDDPPLVTTVVEVKHLVPIGSKFKATHGVGRIGTVMGVELNGSLIPNYVVEYDDAPGVRHLWDLRFAYNWTWWWDE